MRRGSCDPYGALQSRFAGAPGTGMPLGLAAARVGAVLPGALPLAFGSWLGASRHGSPHPAPPVTPQGRPRSGSGGKGARLFLRRAPLSQAEPRSLCRRPHIVTKPGEGDKPRRQREVLGLARNSSGRRNLSSSPAVLRTVRPRIARAAGYQVHGGSNARPDLSHRIDRRDHGDSVVLRPALIDAPFGAEEEHDHDHRGFTRRAQ
jgi:hypothetical protein